MRKDRLYLYTFLSITIIFVIISGIAMQYLVKSSTNQLIETQLESSKREARELAQMIEYQLQYGIDKNAIIEDIKSEVDNDTLIKNIKSGIDKNIIIENIQNIIGDTYSETGFVSMFDWSGTQICHPDKRRRNLKVPDGESLVSSINEDVDPEDFYNILLDIQKNSDNEQISRIIYQSPLTKGDSGWIIGAHLNITQILNKVKNIQNRFYIIFIIIGFFFVLASGIMVRIIGSRYEKNLEAENKKLEDEVINLAKLNKAIDRFQQKQFEREQEQKIAKKEEKQKSESNTNKNTDSKPKEKGKKRILTYLRNEILTVNVEDIAYIYTENTITYVVNKNGKRSTVNSSLDELQSNLDNNRFYRANRQFIISIIAIEKIIRYGNNQLKILMTPESENDIIIGKNKAAEFKQWLNL